MYVVCGAVYTWNIISHFTSSLVAVDKKYIFFADLYTQLCSLTHTQIRLRSGQINMQYFRLMYKRALHCGMRKTKRPDEEEGWWGENGLSTAQGGRAGGV
jgi:hypothetical protein